MSADYFCNGTGNRSGLYRSGLCGEKPISVPLCSPQIPHGMEQDRTRSPEVTGRRLIQLWNVLKSLITIHSTEEKF
jgi:hypothetical protein